jgi:hypothetical protein
MKIYFTLIFLILEASVLASNISKSKTISDTAIFKIEEQVFYLSDVNRALKDVNTFRCLNSRSILINSLRLSKDDYLELDDFVSDYVVLNRRQEQLDKILVLHKMLLYSAPVTIQVSTEDLDGIGFNKCFKGKELSNTMKLMIKAEFHLRDRFIRNRKSFKMDENLLEKLRIFYSGIDRKLRAQVYFR